MDEATAVAAIGYTRGNVVTAHVDGVDFRVPVTIGRFLEAQARAVALGRTSLAVEVVLKAEDRRTWARMVTTTDRFVLVAVDAGAVRAGSRPTRRREFGCRGRGSPQRSRAAAMLARDLARAPGPTHSN